MTEAVVGWEMGLGVEESAAEATGAWLLLPEDG
jgi:hypothetical protein